MRIHDYLRPHEQKLLLRGVEAGDRQIALEIYAGLPAAETPNDARGAGRRIERLGWLPDEDSNLEPTG